MEYNLPRLIKQPKVIRQNWVPSSYFYNVETNPNRKGFRLWRCIECDKVINHYAFTGNIGSSDEVYNFLLSLHSIHPPKLKP